MSKRPTETKPTTRQTNRVARAVQGHQTAAEAIGPIVPGMSLFCITRGQISMIDVIRHVIESAETPVVASVWTWAVGDFEVEAFEYFFREKRIERATMVIDRSAEQRNVDLIDRWRKRYGPDRVKVCLNHAKIGTIEWPGYRVLVRGSMNLNCNPRFEQFDISEGDQAFDLVREVETELPVLPRLSSCQEANEATGTAKAKALTLEELKPFGGIKTWQK
ncbi:hypothetical protein [Aureliella helgolandensis]|uniref:Phospholipase D-like domain-containing protein n=1 Tax=Aureliella helgolandensis TaxID=2527968 RepID=A0A518GDS0_9BACT|nr:hypothetical protein [Aureliella helgolandensis]QDV26749.1 hypothetical protein Q31a_51280 [Aureliella helgolandensis]